MRQTPKRHLADPSLAAAAIGASPEDMTTATRETCLACNEWATRLATV